jgi:acyl-coenzyme A thioesterase PaaI-like protein
MQNLQERFGAHLICFGCGPANEKGLHLRSYPEGDGVVAEFRAEPHHQAFPGVLNGGIIGTLLDCHSNWAAAWALMRASGATEPPCTVTADFHVKLRRPTPITGPITLRAKAVEQTQTSAVIEATLEAEGKICATCRGTFIAVKEGHPAFYRWG